MIRTSGSFRRYAPVSRVLSLLFAFVLTAVSGVVLAGVTPHPNRDAGLTAARVAALNTNVGSKLAEPPVMPTAHGERAAGATVAMPPALRAAYLATLAKDAGKTRTLNAQGCASAASLDACFTKNGAQFKGAAPLTLQLAAWGRGGDLARVATTEPRLDGNEVRYSHGNLTEWWKVLPVGFEQGFTIAKRPAGSGELTLALATNAPASESQGDLAWGQLRYGQLVVTDAKGEVIPATLKTEGKRVLIAVNDAHAIYPLTVDPLVWIEQEVTASDGAPYSDFGGSVAISGTTAIIGAPFATVGSNLDQGKAYVFTESGGVWTQTQKLIASDGAQGDEFGVAVAVDGSTAVVGAWGAAVSGQGGAGAAYVFTESGGTWTQADKLTASDGTANADFGNPVALDGTTAMVGEFSPGGIGQGAVYVFNDIPVCGGNYMWQEGQKLQASDGAPQDGFGYSIALAGGTAVIGAPRATVASNYEQGAAYVFTYSGGTWAQAQKLVANDGAANADFGWSVGLSGTTALVGAAFATVNGNSGQGAAYVFSESGGNWSQTRELTAGGASAEFGQSVALSGTTALIGAAGATVGANVAQGAVYEFDGSGGNWTQTADITASDGSASSGFGVALAISGTNALIGAGNAGSNTQGAAYFEGQANLSLVLNAPASAAQGSQYQGEMILTNNAATATPPVAAAIPVPTGASYVSATPAQGSCTPAAASIGCTLGSVAGNGGTAKVAVSFKATGAIGTSIANTANISYVSPALSASANTAIAGTPVVSLAPSAVSFSAQAVGTASAAKTVTLSNTGNGDLTNIVLSLSGANAADFTETNTCAATLPSTAGSNSCVITVSFKPTAGGAASATLSIASNAAGSPSTVALTGTGDVPPVANNLTLTATDGQTASGQLTATASSGGTLTYAVVSQPAHGTLTLTASSGSFTYTPAAGYTGSDSFTFTASDGTSTSNTASVAITVNAAPTPPTPPAPPASHGHSGGGGLGVFGLLLLAPLVGWRLRRKG